jgi:hypothetical protein
LQKQILALAYHAAPLDDVEACIKKAHARKEEHLSDTLVQAIKQAIINLDVTIRDERGVEIAEGMAERLMKLHEKLLPDTFPKSLEQARLVAPPLEDEKEKSLRESLNLAATNQVFDAIKKNDEKTAAAIETIKDFARNTTLLNRIHLLYVAFDVLARRGGELPRIDGESYGGWYGALADRFCFEIIGAALERDLPRRIQQILEIGLYYILNGTKKADRRLDIDGRGFRGVPGSDRELGVNCYFRPFGGGPATSPGRPAAARRRGPAAAWLFKTYYEQLQQHPKFIIQRPHTHSASRCLIM